jgi:hypothetical protein
VTALEEDERTAGMSAKSSDAGEVMSGERPAHEISRYGSGVRSRYRPVRTDRSRSVNPCSPIRAAISGIRARSRRTLGHLRRLRGDCVIAFGVVELRLQEFRSDVALRRLHSLNVRGIGVQVPRHRDLNDARLDGVRSIENSALALRIVEPPIALILDGYGKRVGVIADPPAFVEAAATSAYRR